MPASDPQLSMIEVHSLSVGPLGANCHLLRNTETSEAIVVDPGDEPEAILELAKLTSSKIVEIWNTHGHIDHINGNAGVQAATGSPISIHALEALWLASPVLSLSAFCGVTLVPSKATRTWRGGEIIDAIGYKWKIHHAPGHSPGMTVFVCDEEELAIVGDLLMAGSCGRTDLPGGDKEAMRRSLVSLVTEWAPGDRYRVFSGHGPDTTIGREKRSNPLVAPLLK